MIDPSTFLVVFLLSSAVTALLLIRPSSGIGYLTLVLAVVALVVGGVALVASQHPDENRVVRVLSGLEASGRVELASLAAAACIGTLSGLAFWNSLHAARKARLVAASVLYLGSFVTLGTLVAKDVISPYLADPNASGTTGLVAKDVAPGWKVRRLMALPVSPSAITWGNDETLVVAGYAGLYRQNGAVIEVRLGQATPSVRTIGRGLTRPHGVAVHNGSIYVSRSGQYSRAVGGQLVQEATGAITRLRDLNGDGEFELFEDVVSGLPGAQLPDGLHQNNAIVFDEQGQLYITVGTPTDRGPPFGEFDGTILRCDSDGNNREVFARGFRNPFGICFDNDGNLFCTDNDSNATNPGDKLVMVRQGEHYGHPFDTQAGLEVSGVVPPIMRLSSAQGIACLPADVGTPFDDQLIVASYGDNALNAVKIEQTESGVRSSLSFLAKIPAVVAVCTSPDGRIYACSYDDQGLYEVTYE